MGESRRQHPLCIVIDLGRQVTNLIGLVILVYFAQGGFSFGNSVLLFLGVLTVGYTVWLALHWWILTYSLTDEGIEISGGLLSRYRRDIPRTHVQLVETESSLVQRMLGLCSLKMETQGGNNQEAQVSLAHLSRAQAEEIKQHLDQKHTAEDQEEEQSKRPVFRLDIIDLINYAVSSGAWTYSVVFFYAAYRQLPDSLMERLNTGILEALIANSDTFALSFIFASCFVVWMASALWQFVRYYGFTISASGKDLQISYGLLRQYHFTVPLHSIRGIEIKENIGQQLLGIASVYVEINRGVGKGSNEKLLMIPSCQQADVESLAKNILPQFPFFKSTLRRPPQKSLHRYIIKKAFIGIILGSVLAFLIALNPTQASGLVVVSGVTAIFAILGFLSWKYSGFALTADAAMVRSGGLGLTTSIFPKSQVTAVQTKSHLLQRRAGLVNLSFLVRTGSGTRQVAHISDRDALKAYAWLDKFSYMIMATPPELLVEAEEESDHLAETVLLQRSCVEDDDEPDSLRSHPTELSSPAPPA
jgi:putative membrane protein